jgi:thiol-disulfide isomerase/thioredoxin
VWVAAGVLLAGAALSGCEASRVVKAPDFSDIDVATPEMTQIKARGGIADCPTGPVTDGPLPAETLRCLGGGTATDLSTLEGPLVLNFWSSTCEPCEREMPALQEFHERYGDRVPILGVDTHDTLPQLALEKAVRWGVTYPLLADPGGELQGTDLTITGQPTFFFLREDGRITTTKGGLESVDQVVAMVEKQLEIDL